MDSADEILHTYALCKVNNCVNTLNVKKSGHVYPQLKYVGALLSTYHIKK